MAESQYSIVNRLYNEMHLEECKVMSLKKKYAEECYKLYLSCDHFIVKSGYYEPNPHFFKGCIKCGLDEKAKYDLPDSSYDELMAKFFKEGNKLDGYESEIDFCQCAYPSEKYKANFEIGKKIFKQITMKNPDISNDVLEMILITEAEEMNKKEFERIRNKYNSNY